MTLTQGSGRLDLPLPPGHATASLPAWYHWPTGAAERCPIVIVLHGTSRAARTSRDNWVAPAEADGFLVVVPDFELRHFPDPDYAYGKLWSPDPPFARLAWADSHCHILDLLFDAVNAGTGGGRSRFTLYGHSAGAAFAHRYVTFAPQDRTDQAIFANSGWFTLLDMARPLPFGIADGGLPSATLRALLGKQITVLVGEEDRTGPYPGWWPEGAAAQGLHRVARSRTYFDAARRLAAQLDTPFNWRWQGVPGVAHENAKMIAPAARLIAQGRT